MPLVTRILARRPVSEDQIVLQGRQLPYPRLDLAQVRRKCREYRAVVQIGHPSPGTEFGHRTDEPRRAIRIVPSTQSQHAPIPIGVSQDRSACPYCLVIRMCDYDQTLHDTTHGCFHAFVSQFLYPVSGFILRQVGGKCQHLVSYPASALNFCGRSHVYQAWSFIS